ncbi:MAG TPA: right-handed parallel beta-helix repeat-containing protein [Polyangia bacterium]|nr:right-handed parallel beta-helix repeat-containing protein [Polyangia bacterium]
MGTEVPETRVLGDGGAMMPQPAATMIRVTPLLAVLAAVAGCGSFDDERDRMSFWEFEEDTDSETETYDEPEDEDCPENYLDNLGRCIRYVNFQSENPTCGYTWDTSYPDIQSGIDAAFAAALVLGHCEVWVAEGVYRSFEGSPNDSIKLRPWVSVYGGFAGDETLLANRDIAAHPTVIDGREEDGPGHSYHVVLGSTESALDGMIVQGGLADGDPPHHRGGGIYLNAASTKIRNCMLRENRAIDGGAVFIYAMQPAFSDTVFEDNEAVNGGALYAINGLPLFDGVTFSGNRAEANGGAAFFEQYYGGCQVMLSDALFEDNAAEGDGGAVYNMGCSVTVDNGEFDGNSAAQDGGGIATYRGTLTLESCTVSANEAGRDGGGVLAQLTGIDLARSVVENNSAARDAGGIYLTTTFGKIFSSRVIANRASRNGGGLAVLYDTPRVVNTAIAGNRAESGGGIHNGARAEPDLINALLHGNRASFRGGGIYNADLAAPRILNTILWNDFPDEIRDEGKGGAEVSYSLVRGGYPGSFVFDQDPLLRKEGRWFDAGILGEPGDDSWIEGDYHLLAGSPCIDFSDETEAPSHDADGEFWLDEPEAGLPGVTVDMGPLDYAP